MNNQPDRQISVLGETYIIRFRTKERHINRHTEATMDKDDKVITVYPVKLSIHLKFRNKEYVEQYINCMLRQLIIQAFLQEGGFGYIDTDKWSNDIHIVHWISNHSVEILTAWKTANVL